MDDELKQAIKELVTKFALGDMVYTVRERTIEDEEYEGDSWEHPDVLRFSEIVTILENAVE